MCQGGNLDQPGPTRASFRITEDNEPIRIISIGFTVNQGLDTSSRHDLYVYVLVECFTRFVERKSTMAFHDGVKSILTILAGKGHSSFRDKLSIPISFCSRNTVNRC